MNGRVAVLKAYGGDFELREYPVPDPAPGAVLGGRVRLRPAHLARRAEGDLRRLPRDLTFRHEMCGRVARLGAGVTVDSADSRVPPGRIGEAFQQADWMQRAGDSLRISRTAQSMAE